MAKFVEQQANQRDYYLKGAEAARNREMGEDVILDKRFQGLLYREVSPLEIDFLSYNDFGLLTRPRQVGTFYVMTDFNSQADPRQYLSAHRDIFIINMDTPTGKWAKITLADALDNCARFDTNGELMATHRELIHQIDDLKARTRLTPPDGFVDMFLVQDREAPRGGADPKPSGSTGYRLARVKGEMEPYCARMPDIEDMAQSADAAMTRKGFKEKDREYVEDGMKLSQRLYKGDLYNRNVRAFFAAVIRQNDVLADDSIELAPDPLNVGSSDLPYWIDPGRGSNWVAGNRQGPATDGARKYLAIKDRAGLYHRMVHLRPFNLSEANFPDTFRAAGLTPERLNAHSPALDDFVPENEVRNMLTRGELFPSVADAATAGAIGAVFNYLMDPVNSYVIVGPSDPWGFGSFTGMQALAALSVRAPGVEGTRNYPPDVLLTARHYVQALAKYAAYIGLIFPNNPMFEARYCPFYWRVAQDDEHGSKNGFCTFAEGMFSPNCQPILLKTAASLKDELQLKLGNVELSAEVLSRAANILGRPPRGPDLSRLPAGVTEEEALLQYRAELEDWRNAVAAEIAGSSPEVADQIRNATGEVLDRLSGREGPGGVPAVRQERVIPDDKVLAMLANFRGLDGFPGEEVFSDERLSEALKLLYRFGTQQLADTLSSPTEFTRFVNSFSRSGGLGSQYYKQHKPPLNKRSEPNMLVTFLTNEVFDPFHPTGLRSGSSSSGDQNAVMAANLMSSVVGMALNSSRRTGDMSAGTLNVLRLGSVEGERTDVSVADVEDAIATGALEPPAGADPVVWARTKIREIMQQRIASLTAGRRAADATISTESAALRPRYFHSRLCIDPSTFHRLADDLLAAAPGRDSPAAAAQRRALYRAVSIALPMNRKRPREPLGIPRTQGMTGTSGVGRFAVQQEESLSAIANELRNASTKSESFDDIYHAPIGIRNLGSDEGSQSIGQKRRVTAMGTGVFSRSKRQRMNPEFQNSRPPEGMMSQQSDSPFVRHELHDDGMHYYFARNAVIRWSEAAKFGDIWTRIPAQLWVVEPITAASYLAKIRQNVRLLADFLLERPFEEYQMGAIIIAKGGASLGYVWYGNVDFKWGDNVATKVHVGHFTMNWRVVIHNSKAYIVIPDAFGVGYIGGEGVSFFDPFTFNPRSKTLHRQGDIFCFMVPYKSLINVQDADKHRFGIPDPHDITGHWNSAVVGVLLEQNHNVDFSKPHYASAFYYNLVYDFDRLPGGTAKDIDSYGSGAPAVNTVVYQGHEWFHRINDNSYGNYIMSTGMWGPDVYPNVKQARIGMDTVIKDQHYEERLAAVAG
jgi:hypothetical protein